MIKQEMRIELLSRQADMDRAVDELALKDLPSIEQAHYWRTLKRQARSLFYIMNKAEARGLVKFNVRKH